MTVGELIEELKAFAPDEMVYGWDSLGSENTITSVKRGEALCGDGAALPSVVWIEP